MKLLDDFINKVGIDKVLHFLGGGFICSLVTFVAILQETFSNLWVACALPIMGTLIVALLSWGKEVALDDKVDKKDTYAALLGCIPVFIAVFIGVLFNMASH
jgi:hypothetical protein